MKPVVAVFAHPDDEAFGPAGTLAKLAQERDVYIICVTDGAAGINSSDKTDDLADIRKDELRESAKLLGIKNVVFLGYKDGSLSNNLYHEVAEKITAEFEKLQPEIVITYENRGVSGHIDHIAVSLISTYVFERLENVRELWYYCITEKRREAFKDYYIYFPPGYNDEQISKKIDVSDVWDLKIQAMHQHESQAHDIERTLRGYQDLPKEENFIILKK